jgi:outer membrane lipopolysaccharide assembly protein LptE/RlpB
LRHPGTFQLARFFERALRPCKGKLCFGARTLSLALMQVAEVANRQRWWALFRPSVGDECSFFIETCAEILREHGVVLQDLIAITVKRMSILNFLSHIDVSDFH